MNCVLTGDIIDSTMLTAKERMNVLQGINAEVEDFPFSSPYQEKQELFYRGDSFQLVMNEVEQSLLLCLILRCKAIKETKKKVDIRISIGIGKTEYLTDSIVSSDGEAFRNSGRSLEQMKEHRIVVTTENEHWNKHVNTSFALLDEIMSKWSTEMTQAVYFSLKGETQQEIADRYEVKQPAIHKRLKHAGYQSIEQLIKHYEQAVQWII